MDKETERKLVFVITATLVVLGIFAMVHQQKTKTIEINGMEFTKEQTEDFQKFMDGKYKAVTFCKISEPEMCATILNNKIYGTK